MSFQCTISVNAINQIRKMTIKSKIKVILKFLGMQLMDGSIVNSEIGNFDIRQIPTNYK